MQQFFVFAPVDVWDCDLFWHQLLPEEVLSFLRLIEKTSRITSKRHCPPSITSHTSVPTVVRCRVYDPDVTKVLRLLFDGWSQWLHSQEPWASFLNATDTSSELKLPVFLVHHFERICHPMNRLCNCKLICRGPWRFPYKTTIRELPLRWGRRFSMFFRYIHWVNGYLCIISLIFSIYLAKLLYFVNLNWALKRKTTVV